MYEVHIGNTGEYLGAFNTQAEAEQFIAYQQAMSTHGTNPTWDGRSEERKALDRCLGHLGNALTHLRLASAAAGAANCDEQLIGLIEAGIKHIDHIEIDVLTIEK